MTIYFIECKVFGEQYTGSITIDKGKKELHWMYDFKIWALCSLNKREA